ncbi:MAG: hypothetical protein KDB79_10340 [Acidobacteria bacterium]|nr:hypothetical protein [Acidobacteriota bacterium]
MSFTLIDLSSENYELPASVWAWKTAVEIIRSYDIVADGTLREIGSNASGVSISDDEAQLIGGRIRSELLPKLEPNKRIFSDLSITDEPDDGVIHKDESEQWRNYSASYAWLEEFSEFCLKSKGFQVF